MTFKNTDFTDSFQYAQYFHQLDKDLDFAIANGEKWTKWKKWEELSIEQKIGINHRGILSNEIVFDIENKNDHIELEKLLQKEGFNFSTWDTGGKGTHTHLFFDKPLESKQKLFFVQKIEKTINIQLDESAVKGRRVIGIELGYHRKTGKRKTLIMDSNGLEKNNFPIIPIEEKKINAPTPSLVFNPSDCIALQYAMKNKIPEGNRHLVLSKNFAIWTHKHPNREALRKCYLETQEMPNTDLIGWDKAIEEGKISKVNCVEIHRFFSSIGRSDLTLFCRNTRRCIE